MKPLLLLHGAIGAASQMHPLATQLEDTYRVYTPDFMGHGGRPFTDAPFSIKLFAENVLELIEKEQLDKTSIFGYSMGGYVAMYLAKNYSEKIEKVITLATKYHWDEETAAKETKMLDPNKIEQKVPVFAESLHQMHAPNDWKEVLSKTSAMMVALGKNNTLKTSDYASIHTPALLLVGDKDKMVPAEETTAVQQSLPNAQITILPQTPHPFDQVDMNMLAETIKSYIQ